MRMLRAFWLATMRILRDFGPELFVLAIILAFTLMPGKDANAIVAGGRSSHEGFTFEHFFWKGGHISAYAALAGTIALGVCRRQKIPPVLGVLALSALTALAVAVLSEPLQNLTPGRYPRISDVKLDISGIMLGILAAKLLILDGGRLRLSLKRRKNTPPVLPNRAEV
jgi:VanZ family protein